MAPLEQQRRLSGRSTARERARPKRQDALLQLEQQPLALEPAAVAGQAAVRADDAVAGDDHGDRVLRVGKAHGAGRVRSGDLARARS